MSYQWELKTAPTVEPVTLAEVKLHLRVDHSADDTVLSSLIKSARQEVETETGRAIVTQTRLLRLSCFPDGSEYRLQLPGSPVASISSVKYIDDAGSQQSWSSANYALRQGEPAWLQLGYDKEWPEHRSTQDEIEIEYVCGSAVSSIDERLKQAVLFKVQATYSELDEKETRRVIHAASSLVQQLRIGEEFTEYGRD